MDLLHKLYRVETEFQNPAYALLNLCIYYIFFVVDILSNFFWTEIDCIKTSFKVSLRPLVQTIQTLIQGIHPNFKHYQSQERQDMMNSCNIEAVVGPKLSL